MTDVKQGSGRRRRRADGSGPGGDGLGGRVTLQDVADRAGVSLTTASRVLNDGARRVGKELADRVHKAAGELGYTANLQARAVATGQSTMIGVAGQANGEWIVAYNGPAGQAGAASACGGVAARSGAEGFGDKGFGAVVAGGVTYPFLGVADPRARRVTYCKRDQPPVPSDNIPVSRRCLR